MYLKTSNGFLISFSVLSFEIPEVVVAVVEPSVVVVVRFVLSDVLPELPHPPSTATDAPTYQTGQATPLWF